MKVLMHVAKYKKQLVSFSYNEMCLIFCNSKLDIKRTYHQD
jgi:hypothetical protein